MVRATRARRYDAEASDNDQYTSRPPKRRKVAPSLACATSWSPPRNPSSGGASRQRTVCNFCSQLRGPPDPHLPLIRRHKCSRTRGEEGVKTQSEAQYAPILASDCTALRDSHVKSCEPVCSIETCDQQHKTQQEKGCALAASEQKPNSENVSKPTHYPSPMYKDTENESSIKGPAFGDRLTSIQNVEGINSCHEAFMLGSSITPPASAQTPPPEYVYEDLINPEFGSQVKTAYLASLVRDAARRHKYGAAIADFWKRGSTPAEARTEWERVRASHVAELDVISDSD